MNYEKSLLLAVFLSFTASLFAVEVEIDGLWYEVVSKTHNAKVLRYKNNIKYSGKIVIPETVEYEDENYTVTSIANNAFYGCINLGSVTIPNSVTSIGYSAFVDCTSLHSVILSNNLTMIEVSTFSGCWALSSIIIPNSVTSIGPSAFYDCRGLTSVIIPNNVTSIGNSAFSYCYNLNSVTIPNSVTSIGGGVFNYCTSLSSVTIPNNVTIIESGVFSECSSLTSVTIPNSVTFIGNVAFEGCRSLTSITLPQNLTSIGRQAFDGCISLTSLSIPNKVEIINEKAFYGCSGLTTIFIGNGVKTICKKAFANCPELVDVYCYTENVPNMISIGYNNSSTPCTDAFEDSEIEYATLHVPASAVNAYSNTAPWSNFKYKVAIGEQEPSYTLTYMLDGIKYVECNVGEGETITPEPAPTKNGYTFSGWSEIPETMPAHDVTVTGSFTINKYKLIYKVDDSDYKSYELEYGAMITLEPEPTKNGYTFSGWSAIPETMPAHDVTVTGSFTKITQGRCAMPTIALKGGKLIFECETPDVEFNYNITANGSKSGKGNYLSVIPSFTVRVYASKEGMEDSETAAQVIYYKNGDANGDGMITVTDIGVIVDMILGKTPANARKQQEAEPQ